MSSTFGGLNAMMRGIYAQQVSLDTVGHNIANANTEGYSRQKVTLITTRTETLYTGQGPAQKGTGVTVQAIKRARDTFVDRQYWKESSSLGYGQTTEETLGKIEGVFREPTETGLQKVLDQFWSAWQTLSVNASDEGARTTVRQRGVQVADAIQHGVQQLKDMAADINAVLDIKVNRINQISSEIYALNRQIANIETGHTDHANDLRDRRDLLVDELSKMTKVTVTEDNYGCYQIQTAGVALVDGNGYMELETRKVQDPDYGYSLHQIYVKGSTQQAEFINGEIKGLLDSRDDSVMGVKGYLDKFAAMSEFLLKDFNAVHKSGYGTNNLTGTNFFGADGTDYQDPVVTSGFTKADWIKELKVNAKLFTLNGLEFIAAKTSSAQGNASGDNAVLLGQRLKSDPSAILGNASLDSFYNGVVGALGVQAQNAQRLTDNQEALVNQIKNWRESTAGVNMDEEMTDMIRFQKGYNAAARVLTTMDEMLDKLINGTGVVGR